MNSRRSKSVKLVSSKAQQIEVEIEETSQMGSSAMNTVYCCIAKGSQILYTYNSNSNSNSNLNSNSNSKSRELESLALICLENTPVHHKHYFHTVGTRTFGYIMADGLTYFAIVDPSVGNLGILHFLQHVRDEYRNSVRNGLKDSLVPVIKRLIVSLDNMPRSTFFNHEICESGTPSDSSTSKMPLLGKSGSRKKLKDREKENDENAENRGVRVDTMPEEGRTGTSFSLDRATSMGRNRRQLSGRNLWCRHVKIVIAIDVVICVVLFIVWLVVCKGFQCVK
ncbi:Phytolongin Phyl1.1 [Rhynchospora pubera]|uniref:Phytolongin Phyl1.1 n=1 Tax=Rhynchospora pubera TaxID=906938 RepID=A0AAV8EP95_9POAL|nr:Phytolongin Phyl1.1 [Rhynchospora pubera]